MTGRASPLPYIYLAVAIPLGLFNVVVVPPLQIPDEPAHFLKTAQLASGTMLSYSENDHPAGGHVDRSIAILEQAFTPLAFRAASKTSPEMFAHSWAADWASDTTFRSFVGSAVNPPMFYIPQTVGIWIGQKVGMSLIYTFYLARLVNLACSVAICFLALSVAERGTCIFLATLLMPMTLYQMASVSPDASLIASSTLLAALLTRVHSGENCSLLFPIISLLCLSISLARLPLVLFSSALLLPIWGEHISLRQRIITFVTIVVCTGGWAYYGATSFWCTSCLPTDVSWKGQVAHFLTEPLALPRAIFRTFQEQREFLIRSFVGILGWLDFALPGIAYRAAYASMFLACIASLTQKTPQLRRVDFYLFSLIFICCSAGLVGIFYFTWTSVGHTSITGVQGRYFLCIVPWVALCIPGFKKLFGFVHGLSVLGTVVALLVCNSQVPISIFERYYVSSFGQTEAQTAESTR